MYTTIHIVRSIIYGAVARGASLQELCKSTGISSADLTHSEKSIAGVEAIIALWKSALDSTRENSLGLHIGREVSPALLGLVGYLMQNSPTVKDAFSSFIAHQKKISGWFSYNMKLNGEETNCTITLHPLWLNASPLTGFHSTSMAMGALLNIFQMLSSRKIEPLRVELAFPGKGLREGYEKIFNCPVLFSKTETKLVFRKADLDSPVLNYDKSFYALFNNLLRSKEEETRKQLSFSDQLQNIVISDFKGQAPPLEIIASHMNLGVRSFQRKLKENGINYRAIAKTLKKDLAIDLLKNSTSKVADVAKVLGYTEVTAFRKAFKGWTNATPAMVRKTKKEKSK